MSDRFARSSLTPVIIAVAVAAQASLNAKYNPTHKKGMYVGVSTVDEAIFDVDSGNRHPDKVKYDGSEIVSRKFNESATRMNSFVQDYCDKAIQSQLLETGNVIILDKQGRVLSKEEVLSLRDDAKALLNVGAVVGEVKYTGDMEEGQLENLKLKAAYDASILARQLSDYKKKWMDVRYDELGKGRTFQVGEDEVASYVAQQNLGKTTTIWRQEPLHEFTDIQKNSSAAEIRKGHPGEGNVVHGFCPADVALNRLYWDDTEWNREWRDMMSRIKQEAPRFVVRGDITGKEYRQDKEPSMSSDLHSLNLDDPNGDWCKCEEHGVEPGCKDETNGLIRYIQCQCAKCGKINVEYARRALAMEKEIKAQGGQTQWLGNRSDAVKAANTQK